MRFRTSDLTGPGYRRRRHGRGFGYLDTRGRALPDGPETRRVRDLAVPPAWQDVWISPHPNGHIQAVGTDEAGRRQYLYHPSSESARRPPSTPASWRSAPPCPR